MNPHPAMPSFNHNIPDHRMKNPLNHQLRLIITLTRMMVGRQQAGGVREFRTQYLIKNANWNGALWLYGKLENFKNQHICSFLD